MLKKERKIVICLQAEMNHNTRSAFNFPKDFDGLSKVNNQIIYIPTSSSLGFSASSELLTGYGQHSGSVACNYEPLIYWYSIPTRGC